MVPVHWDLLNIVSKCKEATSFEAASETLLLILNKSRSLKRYLSVDNKLTLNQITQFEHVVCGYIICKKIFLFDFRKFFDVFSVSF